jgi:hypothetical protein
LFDQFVIISHNRYLGKNLPCYWEFYEIFARTHDVLCVGYFNYEKEICSFRKFWMWTKWQSSMLKKSGYHPIPRKALIKSEYNKSDLMKYNKTLIILLYFWLLVKTKYL